MKRQPNVVMILIDDLGWADLSCFGSTFHQTPHLDALAASGTRWSDAYASAPVCSPARASLLTGQYPARVGITQWIGGQAVGRLGDVPYHHGLPSNQYCLARAFRAGGYATWHVGKWHLGGGAHLPQRHGFDVNIGGSHLGHPPSYFSPYGIDTLPDGPDGEYLTDRLTDEAIGLVSDHCRNDPERPFFLNLWHYAVHTPIQSPPELIEKAKERAAALGLTGDPFERGEPYPTWHQHGQQVVRRTVQSDPDYAAMITNLDDNIGRLIACLRELDLWENTLIVFTSDNGGLSSAEGSPTCNSPLSEGKGWLTDGGIRVPLIASYPDHIPAGRVSDTVATTPDLYPTVLSACGLDWPEAQHLDGMDLWQHWQGGEADRGAIYWHYPHYSNQGSTPGAAIRRGPWKLIREFESGRERLFHLVEDIGETEDRAAQEPELVRELSALLTQWSHEVSALIPGPNPYPYPFVD